MEEIRRYKLEFQEDEKTQRLQGVIVIPVDAKILKYALKPGGTLNIWCAVKPRKGLCYHKFEAVKTDGTVPDEECTYIDTVLIQVSKEESVAYHLFDLGVLDLPCPPNAKEARVAESD